jgi:hypothetical protein
MLAMVKFDGFMIAIGVILAVTLAFDLIFGIRAKGDSRRALANGVLLGATSLISAITAWQTWIWHEQGWTTVALVVTTLLAMRASIHWIKASLQPRDSSSVAL